MINDISAGELDPAMFAVAARYDVPYVAMHMKGDPQTMQSLTDYRRDIVSEVVAYFRRRVERMLAAGIRRERIVLILGASDSPRPRSRTTACSPGCTSSVRWATRCSRGFRASR